MRAWPFVVGISALSTAVAVGVLVADWDADDIQYVHDATVAWSDPISDEAAAIAGATGMTAEGELIYRASRPAIEAGDAFNERCALEGGAVLGCYSAGTIYVYDVTDERLAGTVEVTAAHEMLHAAYERLSDEERAEVDALVAAYVATIPEDDPIYEDLALYGPEQLADEWHSRLGAQFADLGPDLEAHYARYFADRSLVLALNEQATAVFRQLQGEIDALVAEIDALGPVLEARIAAYESNLATLNADIEAFNGRSFSSQEEFDRERGALVARSDASAAEYDAIDAQIASYNDLVAQLTALDASYADLYRALDSTAGAETVEG